MVAGGFAREEDRFERIALGAIARSDLPTKLYELLAGSWRRCLKEEWEEGRFCQNRLGGSFS